MSRFFQFLEKRNFDITEPPPPPPRLDGDVENPLGAPDILSVLHTAPQDLDQPKRAEQLLPLRQVEIKEVSLHPGAHLICQTDPRSAAADRFRYLRMRLRQLRKGRELRRLLITSPLPRDGKSTMALNIVTALAERGKRSVLLIDADFHHSAISQQFGLQTEPGLTECLGSTLNPLIPMRRLEPLGWYFLPAGKHAANSSELLDNEAISTVMQKLSLYFDWIVLDAPPVLPIADALSLAQHCDGSLLVARAGFTPSKAVEDAFQLLGHKHVIGIILNGAEGAKYARTTGSLTYTSD